MSAAKKRGVSIGRPKKLTKTLVFGAREMVETGRQTLASMADLYGVNNSTLCVLVGVEKRKAA